ncbi:isoleucine--tRNA ligase [Actinomycetospora sp. TBRC 11914]|uniref:isoleucine--tRNA ligase n=1 Tax=Actinomycetospora sp. TBRC 11914 TaxID=2729387 RepID=UPI00145F5630|nr:isoleucine--tRNA ligase [Actinomycetospora sp. TBRC 11914]NMO91175.1 isoleucine--tRNA ligase [Actinomycetospora sp. TBRC 11914]
MSPGFAPLPASVDLPSVEQEILERWDKRDVFRRSLEQTAQGEPWIFYEGPPTANGTPGTHHVEARAFKDLFPRFKTMRGYHVPRRAGWDCHGLPVELAVESELGFTSKGDIERYGIAEFNAACRESALRNVSAFAAMTERMGYWVDLDEAYMTMAPRYVESVWWSLKVIHEKGLLVEDHRVTPYCPRDETPLSDHEVALGYEDTVDPSVYVRFPLTDGPWGASAATGDGRAGADMLVWTTTPWTLPSNTAVAVERTVTYARVARDDGPDLVLAEDLVAHVLGDDAEITERLSGAELIGSHYTRPFALLDAADFGDDAWRVVHGDHVTTESGTGLVHMAPAFGAEDHQVARTEGLGMVNPVGPNGHFHDDVPLVGGVFFKAADPALVADLRERGVLFRAADYEHSYPHCWRCHTPLIYYALPSWFIRTTEIRDRLLEENEKTNWYPPHIKHGRYGAWLENNVDWALSRKRYWGTPLPVWRNDADPAEVVVVGSLAELGEWAEQDLSELDPHRPYVDDVTFPAPSGNGTMRRVPDVIDVWYDSGAMPFAQWGAPHHHEADFEAAYPAQYICEAIDQTRGWFYSLMAVGTLVFDRSSYENVVCLGLLLDEQGRKMSKHLGNILDPFELFSTHGADALRWLMLASGSPWVDRRVGHEALREIVRKVLLTYWNTASFLVTYANAAGWTPGTAAPAAAERPAMDRWALGELRACVTEVTEALDDFDSSRAGRAITAFVDDLSNWYVRRSRRRFWDGDPAALATLHECVETVSRLMAPFTPFATDYVWTLLQGEGGAGLAEGTPDSVHLAAWPEVTPAPDGEAVLRREMDLVRRVVELGRSTRAASGVRTRQPLSRAVVSAPGFADLAAAADDHAGQERELLDEISDELNVAAVETAGSDLVEIEVKPNYRALGKRFGKQTPVVADAVKASTDAPVDGVLTVTVDGSDVQLSGDEILVSETPREGWAVRTEGGLSVGLDTELTDELREAGLLRDVLRFVQDTRKQLGFEVSDRIELWWTASRQDTADAIRNGEVTVAAECLAVAVTEGEGPGDLSAQRSEDLGLTVWARVRA